MKTNRALTFSSDENMYAYSFKNTLKGYVVVGRVGGEGNYDGFVLWLDRNLKPLKILRTNWEGNDYLRPCMYLAITSFPVPVSPTIRMLASVLAYFLHKERSCLNFSFFVSKV